MSSNIMLSLELQFLAQACSASAMFGLTLCCITIDLTLQYVTIKFPVRQIDLSIQFSAHYYYLPSSIPKIS